MQPLEFAFSPCPNDTFAFFAWVHGAVEGPEIRVRMEDVEELNRRAEAGEAEITKLSVAAYGRVRETYRLLQAGGAAGFGTGPIVVGREARPVGGRVAIPGERTTAALLLRQLGAFDVVAMRFDRIEDAVLSGEVDCGVLIHEGRFTFAAKGLVLLEDLGAVWERETALPVPLGAIAIRRDLGNETAKQVDAALRASVLHASTHPEASAAFVRAHAQEMDPEVCRRHIQLYVNRYTERLDEEAVAQLLALGVQTGTFPPSDAPVFG